MIMLCFRMNPSEGLSVRHLTKSVPVKFSEGAEDLYFMGHVGKRISITETPPRIVTATTSPGFSMLSKLCCVK